MTENSEILVRASAWTTSMTNRATTELVVFMGDTDFVALGESIGEVFTKYIFYEIISVKLGVASHAAYTTCIVFVSIFIDLLNSIKAAVPWMILTTVAEYKRFRDGIDTCRGIIGSTEDQIDGPYLERGSKVGKLKNKRGVIYLVMYVIKEALLILLHTIMVIYVQVSQR